jgi:hypothetical protein
VDLTSLGTQLQLQPNTTRSEFKVAYDRLNVNDPGRSVDWHILFYAPFVRDAELTLLESSAKEDLNNTRLQSQPVRKSSAGTPPNGTLPMSTELEQFPIYYIEPLDSVTKVGETTMQTFILFFVSRVKKIIEIPRTLSVTASLSWA